MKAPAFWNNPRSPLGLITAPLGWVYDCAGRLRRATVTVSHAPRPVLCVGNINVGGTGKTPIAIDIARRLTDAGAVPHIITRGYGGTEAGPLRVNPVQHSASQTGDEALLLAEAAPTWVARKRLEGAAKACEAGAGCLILDDGFQNPWIAKDLSLVVVDGGVGFGNGRVMPAGPLRERIKAGLARADAVVVVGDDTCDIAKNINRLRPQLPVLNATPTARSNDPSLTSNPVIAFAGIGRPEKFFDTVAAMGADMVERHGFSDHHPYTDDELNHLIRSARTKNATLVTTQKDFVRLPPAVAKQVSVISLSIDWAAPAAVDQLLAPFLELVKSETKGAANG